MKKIDLIHGLTDLDDRLIEEADPYTENETVSAGVGVKNTPARRIARLRVLSGIAAAAIIVVIGFVGAKNGWFKKLVPSDQKPTPVGTATPCPTTPTPTMWPTTPTQEPQVNTPTPTEPIATPTPTMPVATPTPSLPDATPTPTITPRQNPMPTPMGLQEKNIPDNAREIPLSEVKQSDWYACIPEDTFHFYEIINAYAYEDESGPCTLLRLVSVGGHLANGWLITPDGIKINWDLTEADEVYEYDEEVYLTIRNVKDVPQLEARKVKASETERYDITRYEWPLDASIPEDLRLTMEQPIMDASEVSDEVLKLRTCAVKDCFPRKMAVTLGVVNGEYLLDYDFRGIEFAMALAAFGDEEGRYNYTFGSFSCNEDGTWSIYYPGWYVDTDTYEIEHGLTD